MADAGAAAVARADLARRLWRYQAERFPLAAYGPLVLLATYAAAAFSRGAAAQPGFVGAGRYTVGAFTVLVAFLTLRVLDEHKDAAADRAARPELPVPRGLVTLAELRATAAGLVVLALLLNLAVAPALLAACAAVAAWAALMTREFFVPAWLRARPGLYLLSHMAIMPLIFLYATGLDWLAEGRAPPPGSGSFLAAAFLTGTVMEVGRKLRAPAEERPGVDTYTAAWGVRAATVAWLLSVAGSAAAAWAAAAHAGAGLIAATGLGVLVLPTLYTGVRFLRAPAPVRSRRVELASGLWTFAVYLVLALAPVIAGSTG